MACRVGITTDPEERRAYWKRQHSGMHDWRIESIHSSKSEAQAEENRLASLRQCVAYVGGSGVEDDTWYVYYFRY